jgi:hypothetical protein
MRNPQNCPVCSAHSADIPAEAFQCSADFLTIASLELAIHCHESAVMHGGTELFPLDSLMSKIEILASHKKVLLEKMEADMTVVSTAASWLNSELYKRPPRQPGEPCPGCGGDHS